MPMGEYKDFADCVSKNKSKDDPSAYCGYIKHQIEGGKKKEEAISGCPECHEAFHLEEAIKREEEGPLTGTGQSWDTVAMMLCEDKYVPQRHCACGQHLDTPDIEFSDEDKTVIDYIYNHYGLKNEDYPEDKVNLQWSSTSVTPPPEDTTLTPDQIAYLDSLGKGEEAHKTRYGLEMCPHGLPSTDCPRCSVGGLPEPEILGEASAFVDTLKATIDEVTLMAKDTGYHDVSEKVSPTKPTYMYEVKQEMADVVVKQAKGFGTQVNWFNTVIDELDDIRKSAEKFFTDAGWNSKDTIKQYKEHMKKNGADWM